MPKTVLIVDDLSFMRNALKEILESSGFSISGEAENGKQGIELYFSLNPDVVLMDITMPVMNGLTALNEIMKRRPGAKVIMCSALGQEKYIMKAIQLGARDFIVKPFKPERITSAVARIK